MSKSFLPPLGTLAVLALFACGAPAAPAESKKAAPAPLPHMSAIDENRCLASFGKNKPNDWVEVGRLAIALEDGRPVSLTAEDSHGSVVESLPAPKSKAAAQDAMRHLTCRLGGLVLVVAEPAPSSTGSTNTTFPVLAPARPDEKVDLQAFCREPSSVPADAGPDQRYRVAFGALDELLTTKRWRAWLWDLLEESARTDGAARESFRAAKADELHAAAIASGISGACWYEAALRATRRSDRF